jgi:signal transduction histidine kinase
LAIDRLPTFAPVDQYFYLMPLRSSFFQTFIFILISSSTLFSQNTKQLASQSEKLLFEAEFERSFELIDSAIATVRLSKSAQEYYSLLNLKGHIYTRYGSYDSAFSLHSEALQYSVNKGMTALEFETKFYLGVLKLFMSDFEEAKQLFFEVTDFFQIDERKNQFLISRSLTNLAFLAYQKGNFDEAIRLVEKSKKYYLNDSASIYAASNFTLEGLIFFRFGESQLAIEKYQLALGNYIQNSRFLNRSGLYLNLATVYCTTGDIDKCEEFQQLALQTAQAKQLPVELQAVYEYLALYHRDKDQYELAFKYLMERDVLLDSLRNTELVLQVANLENVSSEKMEALQLSLLQEKLTAERKVIKTQRISIFIAIVVSLYLLVFIIVYRRLIREKNRSEQELIIKNNQLEEKTRQIAKAQNLLIQSEKMALLGRISAGIAHEINTPISAIKGNLELIQSVQQMEIEKVVEIIETPLSKDHLSSIIALIRESLEASKSSAVNNSKDSRRQIEKYFSEVEINNKPRVIDYFVDLNVSNDLYRFELVYGNSKSLDILELIMHVVNRSLSISTATTATDKALKILSSFKTYSFKRGWKDVHKVDLSSSMDVMLDLYKNSLKEIDVEKVVEGDPVIEGIQDELDQVWTNLLSNAIYAMSSNGKLKILINGLSNAVSVSIEDTGGGIRYAEDKDIFEPFFTTKPEGEGTGLGLDICKQIVKNHFGSISWKNTDLGAIFTVVLPRTLDKSLLVND